MMVEGALRTAAKYAIIVMFASSGLGRPYAQAENLTEQVLKAIQPQTIAVRECYVTTAALYVSKTCEAANVVIEAVFAKCVPQEQELSQAYTSSSNFIAKLKLKADDPFVKSFSDGTRDGGRRLMLKTVFDKRAELGNCLPVKHTD